MTCSVLCNTQGNYFVFVYSTRLSKNTCLLLSVAFKNKENNYTKLWENHVYMLETKYSKNSFILLSVNIGTQRMAVGKVSKDCAYVTNSTFH